jgi:uncharacterized protein (DUF2336 family)
MLGLKRRQKQVEPQPVSNRRAAMLARSKAVSSEPKEAARSECEVPPASDPADSGDRALALTHNDVIALKKDKSPAVRGSIARKFGRQFDSLNGGGSKGLADGLLMMLLKDVSVDVRSALATEVAGSKNLPANAVSQLARDDIRVAMPVLQQSPLLDDETLKEIVRTQSMQYALAVAGREHVSEDLSEALIDTGDRDVVLKVAGNAGAKVSQQAMQRVVDDFSEDLEIQDRMSRRPALPFEIAEQLVGIIGAQLEWDLVNTRRLNPDEAKRIMDSVNSSVSIGVAAKAAEADKQMKSLRTQMQSGDFEHADVVKALRDGDIQLFELGLALFARLDHATARKQIYSEDRRRLAAVCAAGDFSPPHYLTIRMALELAHEASSNGQANGDYGEDSVRYVLNQYERMRLHSDMISEMLTT